MTFTLKVTDFDNLLWSFWLFSQLELAVVLPYQDTCLNKYQ